MCSCFLYSRPLENVRGGLESKWNYFLSNNLCQLPFKCKSIFHFCPIPSKIVCLKVACNYVSMHTCMFNKVYFSDHSTTAFLFVLHWDGWWGSLIVLSISRFMVHGIVGMIKMCGLKIDSPVPNIGQRWLTCSWKIYKAIMHCLSPVSWESTHLSVLYMVL